jgi:hypothetical protein
MIASILINNYNTMMTPMLLPDLLKLESMPYYLRLGENVQLRLFLQTHLDKDMSRACMEKDRREGCVFMLRHFEAVPSFLLFNKLNKS